MLEILQLSAVNLILNRCFGQNNKITLNLLKPTHDIHSTLHTRPVSLISHSAFSTKLFYKPSDKGLQP